MVLIRMYRIGYCFCVGDTISTKYYMEPVCMLDFVDRQSRPHARSFSHMQTNVDKNRVDVWNYYFTKIFLLEKYVFMNTFKLILNIIACVIINIFEFVCKIL